jgi:hypothetical protein
MGTMLHPIKLTKLTAANTPPQANVAISYAPAANLYTIETNNITDTKLYE